jgi:O-acetyl-ADP-ribose deacetylase
MSVNIGTWRGDITTLNVDAIVNAANTSLLGGGGVDGAIHRAAGPKLRDYCERFGGCEVADAVITPAFKLPCKYVIHTVGPVWHGGRLGEVRRLYKAYVNSLDVAQMNGCKTIAFPCISCGAYAFPQRLGTKIAVCAVSKWLERNKSDMRVIFVTFTDDAQETYHEELQTQTEKRKHQ